MWLEQEVADDFNIISAQLSLFVELVIPELQRRGLFRKEYAFSTLRENLGLPAINP